MVELEVSDELFPGFYNTYLDPSEDEDLDEEDFENYKNIICERVVDIIEKEFTVVSWELESPKYYNYHNDKLFVKIDWELEDFVKEFVINDIYYDIHEYDFGAYTDNYKTHGFMEAIMHLKIWEGMSSDFSLNLEEHIKYG